MGFTHPEIFRTQKVLKVVHGGSIISSIFNSLSKEVVAWA